MHFKSEASALWRVKGKTPIKGTEHVLGLADGAHQGGTPNYPYSGEPAAKRLPVSSSIRVCVVPQETWVMNKCLRSMQCLGSNTFLVSAEAEPLLLDLPVRLLNSGL